MGWISNLLTWYERSQLRKKLLDQDERTLADAGFSRELLEEGVRAWPWRLPAEPSYAPAFADQRPGLSEREIAAAVAELRACSDDELWDMGLTRGTIEEAVRYGRPGFPEEHKQAA